MSLLHVYKNAMMWFTWYFHVESINKSRENRSNIKRLPGEAYSRRSFTNKGQMVTK